MFVSFPVQYIFVSCLNGSKKKKKKKKSILKTIVEIENNLLKVT
jgi:hypothetical protein